MKRNLGRPVVSKLSSIYEQETGTQPAKKKPSRSHSVYHYILFLLLAAALSTATNRALAQFTTARLSGVVTDNLNAAMPDATVTALQVSTGYKQTAKTGASGDYLFPSLPIGTYRLNVEANGFTPYVQDGIVLNVNQAASVNVKLLVGSVSQQVTVHADASLVTTDDPTIGQLVNQKSIEGLPLNGREVQQLVFLVPNAVDVSSQNCLQNCEGGVLPGEQDAKVSGGGANGVYYLLDGVDYNDIYINTNLPFPSPDALEEFSVQTGNMSASYGNATGGVVNAVSKSGTNDIHGNVFEFLRNYAMDAKNYFATSPDPLKQNQFGGTVGGPILKDKLFYFGSYQGTRTNSANNGLVSFVPTATERAGNFADLLNSSSPVQLVNPVTGVPYVNNQVPTTQFDKTALYLLQHIPLPNGPGRQLTYNGAPTIQDTDEYLGKVDYNIGKHHLSAHYFQLNYNIPVILPPASNVLAGNPELPQNLKLKNVSVVDIYTISPNILLNSYFGWTSQTGDTLSAAPFTIADAGAQIAQPTNFKPTLNIAVNGGSDFDIGDQPASGNWNRGDSSLREIATFIKGTNEIQFGGEVRRVRAPMGNTYEADGNYNFAGSYSGDNIADFMLGVASSFAQGGGLYLNFTGYNSSLFLQDNWHATPRLTLNAGLRWDPFTPYTDSEGRVGCYVPGAQSTRFPNAPMGLIFGGSQHDAGCPNSSIYNKMTDFGPRLGFAYQLNQSGKSSLRGGVGYYYEPPNLVAFEDVVGIPPFQPLLNFTDVNFTNPYGIQYGGPSVPNPFPAQFGPSNTTAANASFPADISFQEIFDRHYQPPQILSYNLTLEQALGANFLIRAAYSGNKGDHLSGTGDQESGLLEINAPVYQPGATQANEQQRRPNPNFGFVHSINAGVNSNYNAVALTFQSRVNHGLSFLSNFTWSRSLDDFGPNGQPGLYNTNTCSCGRYFDYGPDGGDVNKVFRISGDYAFPKAPFKGFLNSVVNGWDLSVINNWQTGFPFTVFAGDDNSLSGMGADRADLTVSNIKSAVLSNGRSHANLTSEWFNTNDFQPNQVGTFGDTGKNPLRGPRLFNTDASLVKNTKLTERVNTEFRAEFFNVFNNVNFGLPDQNLGDGPGAFGTITSAQAPRILQMALKVSF